MRYYLQPKEDMTVQELLELVIFMHCIPTGSVKPITSIVHTGDSSYENMTPQLQRHFVGKKGY